MSFAAALLAPLALQAIAMGFDELFYHRKRGLGRWERLGHPLDTLTMLACIGWILLAAPTSRNVAIYVALGTLSCVFITKDEFVHARRCSPGEHWVHAFLFVLHPLTLLSLGVLWPSLRRIPGALFDGLCDTAFAHGVLEAQFAMTAGFCVYQAIYWNISWTQRAPLLPG